MALATSAPALPPEIQPASPRNGRAVVACGAGAEILEQLQLFAAMEQHGGQFCIDTMVAVLNQPDRPVPSASEVGGKIAQHAVRVLIPVIDQRRQIALGI